MIHNSIEKIISYFLLIYNKKMPTSILKHVPRSFLNPQ